MTAFAVRRLGLSVIVVLGVSVCIFFMLRLVPGNPVTVMLSQHATLQDRAQLEHELGLDQPIYVQYGYYAEDLIEGDLGRSIRLGLPVSDLILERLPATLELAAASLLLATVIGVTLGVLAAAKRGRATDQGVMLFALMGISLPSFWVGLMLILLFGVEFGLLPIAGNEDGLASLVLPAITLALIPLGVIVRLARSTMVEVLNEDYIVTARAKGAPYRRVLIHHALRNSLIPLITVVGVQFGVLLGGAIIVETVFAWPGIGRLLIDAVSARDFPLVQGIVLFMAVGFVLVNLAVDLLYAVVDPRVRDQVGAVR